MAWKNFLYGEVVEVDMLGSAEFVGSGIDGAGPQTGWERQACPCQSN